MMWRMTCYDNEQHFLTKILYLKFVTSTGEEITNDRDKENWLKTYHLETY